MPATIITNPSAANVRERATGACTISPWRVRPVVCTRELPLAFELRTPACRAADLGVALGGGAGR